MIAVPTPVNVGAAADGVSSAAARNDAALTNSDDANAPTSAADVDGLVDAISTADMDAPIASFSAAEVGSPRAAIAWATSVLQLAGVPTPAVDAALLAAHSAGLTRSEFEKALLLGSDIWGAAVTAEFVELVSQRRLRVPLQHLTGKGAFRYLELAVGPGVFIPRPETETVAQHGIDFALQLPQPAVLVDLCTGSGAIAISLLTEVPGAQVYAVELDRQAHAWAAQNVAANPRGDGKLVDLVRGDARTALTQLDGTVDAVISNPPYVPPGHIPREVEVSGHDPQVALYGLGDDGLEVPRGITMAAARLLRPGGLYVMEHAEVQAVGARQMVDATGYFDPADTQIDLTGRDRMVVARRNHRKFESGTLLEGQPQ